MHFSPMFPSEKDVLIELVVRTQKHAAESAEMIAQFTKIVQMDSALPDSNGDWNKCIISY